MKYIYPFTILFLISSCSVDTSNQRSKDEDRTSSKDLELLATEVLEIDEIGIPEPHGPELPELPLQCEMKSKCDNVAFLCGAEVVGTLFDIAGQAIHLSCGIEFPVGATIGGVLGIDPDASIEENLARLGLDLVCQVIECLPPTDPFTIAAKCACGGYSVSRTITSCTDHITACHDEKMAQPLTEEDFKCDLPFTTVMACDAMGNGLSDEEIANQCISMIGGRTDVPSGQSGNCIAQCARDTRQVRSESCSSTSGGFGGGVDFN